MIRFKENDIYALKIEDELSKYNGKYIILIKCSYKGYSKNINKEMFRFKITKDKNIPKLEEINDLEYIVTYIQHELKKYMPFPSPDESFEEFKKERDKVNTYPDKYGYLYTCLSSIFLINKNIPENLIYLGNKQLDLPVHEYISFSEYGYKMTFKLDNIIKGLVNCYEMYNLKKSSMFSKEVAEMAKQEVLGLFELEKKFRKTDFSKIRFDEEEEIEDSLTYVGGEDEDPFK